MEMYVLKSATILTIFFAFYKLFLENTSVHHFKRFYLLGILFASFLIPLITFYSYVAVAPITTIYSKATLPIIQPEMEKTINYWLLVLGTVYGFGVLFLSVKFFKNLFKLIQKIRKNPKYRNANFIHVLLTEIIIPHTFFNYIFLNKPQFENGEIPQEVMLHEQTHAREKHSLDIIFIELLQIAFWFNPLFHFIKKSIKLNHEFLADRAVLNAGAETSEYQKIVLAFSSNALPPSLAHPFNYLSIKKRFTVMKTKTSRKAILLRSLLLLPLLCILVYGFSSQEVIQKNKEISELIEQKDTVKFKGEIIQQKATKSEIAEYNKLSVPVAKTGPKKDSTVIYFKNTIITLEEAEELVKQNKVLSVNIVKSAEGINKVIITEKPNADTKSSQLQKNANNLKTSAKNRNLYMAPEAPPAPNPNKTEYIKELAKRGATFYIGPHKYTTEEAIKMIEKSTNEVTIDVSQYPVVHLGGC